MQVALKVFPFSASVRAESSFHQNRIRSWPCLGCRESFLLIKPFFGISSLSIFTLRQSLLFLFTKSLEERVLRSSSAVRASAASESGGLSSVPSPHSPSLEQPPQQPFAFVPLQPNREQAPAWLPMRSTVQPG